MSAATAVCPPIPSDEQLLGRFAAGAAALDELFRRYRQPAYRVAYRLLGNEADALDAVQEGFVKALTHLHGFQGRSSFKTWLLRVVSNAALDLGRQRGRRETVSLDAAGGDAGPRPVAHDRRGRRRGWNGPTCGRCSTRRWRTLSPRAAADVRAVRRRRAELPRGGRRAWASRSAR